MFGMFYANFDRKRGFWFFFLVSLYFNDIVLGLLTVLLPLHSLARDIAVL